MNRIVSTVVTVAFLLSAGASHGQWAVFDGANFGQTLVTAVNTARQVQQLIAQAAMMRDQLNYKLQSLKTLDPASFDQLLNLYDDGRLTYTTLTSQVDALGFTVGEVDASFTRLFPRKENWKQLPARQLSTMYSNWQSEITGSSQTAMRAQTSLAKVQQIDRAAMDILTSSKVADGEVRQLQGITQMLGVVQSQLASLLQTTTTLSRVLTSAAAAGAGEKQLTSEKKRRRTQGYTTTGPPPVRLRRLP